MPGSYIHRSNTYTRGLIKLSGHKAPLAPLLPMVPNTHYSILTLGTTCARLHYMDVHTFMRSSTLHASANIHVCRYIA